MQLEGMTGAFADEVACGVRKLSRPGLRTPHGVLSDDEFEQAKQKLLG